MLDIDKLRYDYEKPFIDFIDQLIVCENTLYVNVEGLFIEWVFFKTDTHFFVNRSIYIRFLQYNQFFFNKQIKNKFNTQNKIIKYPSSFEKAVIECHLNTNNPNFLKHVLQPKRI